MMTLNIELQPHIEKSLQYLISKQGDLKHFFEDFILYKVSQLEKAIFNIEKDLRKYEQKYKSNEPELIDVLSKIQDRIKNDIKGS